MDSHYIILHITTFEIYWMSAEIDLITLLYYWLEYKISKHRSKILL